MTLPQVLEETASRLPDKPALIFGDRVLTFADYASGVEKVAAGLRSLGVTRGDRVALASPNSDLFALCYLGVMRAGAAVVPVNPLLKVPELEYILSDCGAKVAIAAPHVIEGVRAAAGTVGAQVLPMTSDPQSSLPSVQGLLERPVGSLAAAEDWTEEAHAAVLYTSGTTGRPKGAVLLHRNIRWDAETAARFIELRETDVMLTVLPMFHSFAATVCVVIPLVVGMTAVVLPDFTVSAVCDAIARHGVTIFPGVPAMFGGLLRAADQIQADFSSLRICCAGGAPMPVDLLHRFEDRFGVVLIEGDGPTECGPVTSVNPPHGIRKPGSVGPPLPGVEIRIVDESDNPLPAGELGEIVVRGPNVMEGYLNRPDETAEAMRGGWFHTGDMGKFDPDGYLYIVDRKKDMILVGGFNVYPREIEEILYGHPAVAECAVVGVPDEIRGEKVKAFIVCKQGMEVVASDLVRFCRERLANYKVPKDISFVDQLPKSATGKVLKRVLREMTDDR